MYPNTACARMKTVAMELMALLVLVSLPACATTYSALPISARVVDADSGEPLEDVIVVANWTLEYILPGISEYRGRHLFELAETVTDGRGHFELPAWGPKPVPEGLPGRAFLGPDVPLLVFFKPGYMYEAKGNSSETAYLDDRNYVGELVRHSAWNGKTIGLKRKEHDSGEYLVRLEGHSGIAVGIKCQWERTPRILGALISEGERLKNIRHYNSVLTLKSVEDAALKDGCQSPKKTLGPYLK